ncbi:transcriptional regulator [Niastella vici]|uniref:Transcriptional regulator n=1 Tax=Niastella vici TaxID=1703345 RepID=A0A1V9G0N2_9BACT|nr:transcriptional regulator [Niastella vici]
MEIFSNSPTCPIRNVFDRFGDKWSVLVLMVLGTHGGLMRFGELKEVIDDITQKMLTVTLRTLEADGLVARKYYQEIPPRVEYQLTDLGKDLVPHIENLANWASKHVDQILRSRKRFEKKVASKD